MKPEATRTRQQGCRAPALLGLLVLALCVLPRGAAWAEDAEPGADTTPAKARTGQPDTGSGDTTDSNGKDDTSGSKAKPSSDVFIPSEEISEDFAVSLPVDI